MGREEGSSTAGVLYALGAYGIWGVTPVYWKLVQSVPAAELLAYRVVWSLAAAVAVLALTRGFRELGASLRSPGRVLPIACSALLLAVNWLTFIFAVQTDRVTATSLGYYVTPLISVLLGLAILGERLSRAQALAVAVAGAGVAYRTLGLGGLPWIALVLAVSFGLYGLVRKLAPTGSSVGFCLEMLVLAPLAVGYLVWLSATQRSTLSGAGLETHLLVSASGLVTAAPLLCFASAAKRLRLTSVGLLQYIAPSLTLVLAVALYAEPFTRAHAIVFGCVWLGLALFTLDSLSRVHRQRRVAPP